MARAGVRFSEEQTADASASVVTKPAAAEFTTMSASVTDTTGVMPRAQALVTRPAEIQMGNASLRIAGSKSRSLPRKAKRAALLVPATYSVLCLLVLEEKTGLVHHGLNPLLCLLLVGVPLALVSGGMLRSKRLSSLAGCLFGLGFVLAFFATAWNDNLFLGKTYSLWNWFISTGSFTVLFTVCGTLLGVAGAMVREQGPRLCRLLASALARQSYRT